MEEPLQALIIPEIRRACGQSWEKNLRAAAAPAKST
jgi:hypothetical protein